MISFEYRPLPVFVDFHRSTERERMIVGGYGSGKSHAGVAEVQAIGLEQPGSEILVTRKTAPALRDTTEAIFLAQLPPEFLKQCEVRKAGGHLERVVFPNGTTYYFRSMDDWRKLRSMNLAFILYDEADEFTPEDYEGMNSRLRQTKPTQQARALGATQITRRGTICACNPQGKNWLFYRFVDPGKKAPSTAYWTSSSLDNPFLPLDYINSLLAMPKPWVRRYVLCSFDDLAGAIYEDWAWDTHVIPPLKDLQGRWLYDPTSFFIMGFDPGTSAGNAAVWVYYDKPNHRLIGVAEYDEKGLAATEHAKAWRKLEASHRMRVRTRVADPKAITVRDRGTNMALSDQYRRLGFNFIPGTNDVDTRTTSLGQLIYSRRFVITSDCPQLHEQIKNYRWEDLTPQQQERGTVAKPRKKDVDLVDAAQYIACRYIAPPKAKAVAKDPEAYEIAQAIRRQLAARRNAPIEHDLGTIGL